MTKSMSASAYRKLMGMTPAPKNKFYAKGIWACPKCWGAVFKKTGECPSHPDAKPVYFHSKGEYQYWLDLLLLQTAGQISDLERQVRFDLDVNGVHIGRYTADFAYTEGDQRFIIDFKSKPTDTTDSKLRRKLVYAIHGVEVKIIWNGK